MGSVRKRERRPGMCQLHQIVVLAPTRRAILPGEVAVLTDAELAAQALDGELLFRLIGERKPYRLPSLAKKRWYASGRRVPAGGWHSRGAAASTHRW